MPKTGKNMRSSFVILASLTMSCASAGTLTPLSSNDVSPAPTLRSAVVRDPAPAPRDDGAPMNHDMHGHGE